MAAPAASLVAEATPLSVTPPSFAMPDSLITLIDRRTESALADGALQPIRTEQAALTDGDLPFVVRWVSSLARKDAHRTDTVMSRRPDFNPFLPPDPALTVGPLGEAHLAVLNKFPVLSRHLLVVTREFRAQNAPLDEADLGALARVIAPLGGLGFYNGGSEAGASQAHKHLQWIPGQDGGASLTPFAPVGAGDIGEAMVNPALPWRHAFVPLGAAAWVDREAAGRRLLTAFLLAWRTLGLPPPAEPMAPYNLLVDHDWLLLVPRAREKWNDVSVNALGFAGSLFVRRPEQIDAIGAAGPLRVLAAVAQPL